jgi:hypothetical protein
MVGPNANVNRAISSQKHYQEQSYIEKEEPRKGRGGVYITDSLETWNEKRGSAYLAEVANCKGFRGSTLILGERAD